MSTTRKGKFIVLYGINNLGKSTQAKLLVEKLNERGYKSEYLKYPLYDLEPSGKLLNNYLRNGNIFNLSAREAQLIYALNRTQYQNILEKKLSSGINIVAEDYTGTGIAWGAGAGVDIRFLKYIHKHLLKEDIAFLFDGERFLDAKEDNHKHETNHDLTNKVRWTHQALAEDYGWIKINANDTIPNIAAKLWEYSIKLIDSNYFEKIYQTEAPDFYKLHLQQTSLPNILKVEKLSPTAKLPTRSHDTDAGLDLYADDQYTLLPGERLKIKTGIKVAIPDGYVGLIWDKSGIAANGLKTSGGVIDSGYRGEILISLYNLSHDIHTIIRGQKIAQLLIQKIEQPVIIETKIDDKTSRDTGNFGSTGLV